ncbi:hypothetical protein BH10PSE18_BH10PSE18_39030 [soil metagenome]
MNATYSHRRILWALSALLVGAGLSGCDGTPSSDGPDPLMTEAAIATREAPPEHVFHGTLAGAPAFLVVRDCEVFQVQRNANKIEWTSVVKPEFYPFFTVCERQSLTFEAGVLTATLGRQAIGAGGCCASGGTYRSVDGRNWKKQ